MCSFSISRISDIRLDREPLHQTENYQSTCLGVGPASENWHILPSLTTAENLALSWIISTPGQTPFIVEVDKVGFESTPKKILNDLVYV